MANTIYGLTNYYNLFKSPVSPVQMNPVANLAYSSLASGIYSRTVAQTAQSSISSYLSSLNGNASSLKASAKTLSLEAPSSAMNKKAVASTDNAVITGTANWNADSKTYAITVSRLASGQTNKSAEMKSDASSLLGQGGYSFSINSGGTVKTASFTVGSGDTNKAALGKMATGINNANAGVKAAVVSDEKTGVSYLKINSVNTGTSSSFTLTDTMGNSIAAYGASSVQVQAQNAEYVMDGKRYASQSNTISLNNGKVQLTLNKADNKEIKLTVGTDLKAIANEIDNFVDRYNNMVNLSSQYAGWLSGAARLGSELDGIIKAGRVSLANIGITINSDNTLEIDDIKLSKALAGNAAYVKEIFAGSDGIAGKVYSKTNEIMLSPLKYSQPKLLASDYSNYLNQFFPGRSFSGTGSSGPGSPYSGLMLDLLL